MANKEFTLTLSPSVELAQYTWLKSSVSGTFTGSPKLARKQLELMYWQLLALENDIKDDLKAAHDQSGMKAVKKLIKSKIVKLQGLLDARRANGEEAA